MVMGSLLPRPHLKSAGATVQLHAPASAAPPASSLPDVAKGGKPHPPKPQPQASVHDDNYRNTVFPARYVFQLTTDIYNTLVPFRLSHPTLHHARDMASQDRPFLSGDFGDSIVTLYELIEGAFSVPVAVKSIKATLAKAAYNKAARADLLLNRLNTFSSTRTPRADVVTPNASPPPGPPSVNIRGPSRGELRDRICHAAGRDDSGASVVPPRITRCRDNVPELPSKNPIPLTRLTLEIVMAATVGRHLADVFL